MSKADIDRIAIALGHFIANESEANTYMGFNPNERPLAIAIDDGIELEPVVRAVLQAVREPGEEMLKAGITAADKEHERQSILSADDYPTNNYEVDMLNAEWRAMIDKLLEE